MNLQSHTEIIQNLKRLTKQELIGRLTRIEYALEYGNRDGREAEHQNVVHELEVHQVELEMQNRELRETQIALEKSSESFALLYEHAPVGCCTVDLDGVVRQINTTGQKLFGQRGATMLGMNLSHFFDFECQLDFKQFLRFCHCSNKQQTIEGRCIVNPSGVKFIQLISVRKPAYPSGSKEVLLALVDKTLEKQDRQSESFLLHASEALAHSVGEGTTTQQALQMAQDASSSIVMLDLVTKNQDLIRHLGDGRASQKLSAASDAVALLRNSSKAAIEEYFRRSRCVQKPGILDLSSMRMLFAQTDILQALHDEGIAQALIVPLFARGALIGMMSFFSSDAYPKGRPDDCNVLIRFARLAATHIDNAYLLGLAQESAASRDQMLAIVSHDLRSPLCAIRMRTERLLRGRRASPDSYVLEAASHVVKYAERMDRLINDLLDVSSIESGSLTIKPDKIDSTEVMREILDIWRPVFEAANIDLDCGHVAQQWLRADQERLVQAVGNLVGNALKFTPAGGRVTISTQADGNFLQFLVCDSGKGIDPEEVTRVFDRFWQAESGDKKGIGLGLSITRGIVEAAGGKIWLQSELAKGTKVFFTVPLWEKGAKRDDLPVLVVEDNCDAAALVKEILEESGEVVDVVANGKQALQYLETHVSPKTILLDLRMPIMDGWSFLEKRLADAKLRKLRVIVHSSDTGVAVRAAAFGAEFLPKGCSSDQLLRTVAVGRAV